MGLITKKEASEILGRPIRTLCEWEKNGILKAHRVNGSVYFDANTVNALLDTEFEIDTIVKERKAVCEYIKTELETFRKEENLPRPFLRPLFELIFSRIMKDALSEREIHVFNAIIAGKTTGKVGSELGLSHERVRQIFIVSLHKMKQRAQEYADMREELIGKTKKIENQEIVEKFLRSRISHLEELCNVQNIGADITEEDLRLYKTRLFDTELSTRAICCLTSIGIKNVYDLLKHNKLDIYNIRGIGKKTFMIIVDYVENKLGKKFAD